VRKQIIHHIAQVITNGTIYSDRADWKNIGAEVIHQIEILSENNVVDIDPTILPTSPADIDGVIDDDDIFDTETDAIAYLKEEMSFTEDEILII